MRTDDLKTLERAAISFFVFEPLDKTANGPKLFAPGYVHCFTQQDGEAIEFVGSFAREADFFDYIDHRRMAIAHFWTFTFKNERVGITIDTYDNVAYTTVLEHICDPNTGELIVRRGDVFTIQDLFAHKLTAIQKAEENWQELLSLPRE